VTGELRLVERLVQRFGSAPAGETWAGDDTAVLRAPAGTLLFAIDPVVEGVHFLPGRDTAADVGWRAMARNLSDLAAMGGAPHSAVASVLVPDPCEWDLDELADGLAEAAESFGCPVVGGDVSTGPVLVVTVAVTGSVVGEAVLRSGAQPGDTLFVTGALGGLPRRPRPRLAEGQAARAAGATAMIDTSDGLPLDLRRVARASGVGVALDEVPVVPGGSFAVGDDYELVFAAPDPVAVLAAFDAASLSAPIRIGRCTDSPGSYTLGDGPLPEGGWEHTWH
jgi:thiamine-monophosphate kinase